MPTIDVYAASDIFPHGSERALAKRLTAAILRAERFGDEPAPMLRDIVGAYFHFMAPENVHTLASDRPRTVRVQVTSHPGGLDEQGRNEFISEATSIVAEISGDPGLAERTWVILVESMQGGWGIAGRPVGGGDGAALRVR